MHVPGVHCQRGKGPRVHRRCIHVQSSGPAPHSPLRWPPNGWRKREKRESRSIKPLIRLSLACPAVLRVPWQGNRKRTTGQTARKTGRLTRKRSRFVCIKYKMRAQCTTLSGFSIVWSLKSRTQEVLLLASFLTRVGRRRAIYKLSTSFLYDTLKHWKSDLF